MNNSNLKSDINAKEAFIKELTKRGYDNVHIISAPADIEATKNGKKQYFEIKKTGRKDKYFGAATFTEWHQAYKDPENYYFVLAVENDDGEFTFFEKTPAEFEEYCTIPPLKVYFNIDLNESDSGSKNRKIKKCKTVRLTQDTFNTLYDAYNNMKESQR